MTSKMTSLEKMLKRLEFEHKNDIRELKGEPLLAIPVELMTEDEYKDFLKSKTIVETKKVEVVVKPVQKEDKSVKTKSSTNPVKTEPKVISRTIVNKPTEEVKKEDKPVETKKVEVVKISEPKNVVVETSKEGKEENSMKEAVNILKRGLEKIGLSPEEQTAETPKEETVEENNKSLDKEIIQIKKKLLNISKDVLNNSTIRKVRIEDYNKLSSSKKKIAISNMLKEIVTEVAEPSQMQDILNFSCNINTIAGNNNKREYNSMLKAIKESISKMKDNSFINKIINKIDSEINNFILVNKVKFISYIKNMESNLEINERNLAEVSSAIDSITSRINNGEDFLKIINSLKDSIFLQKQPVEAKVVDSVENAEEENKETDNEEIIEDGTEPIFLSPEEIDALENTMHEVLMGNL